MHQTKKNSQLQSLLTVALFALCTFILPQKVLIHSRFTGAPLVMLWAWERPEDLRQFGHANIVGTAFLAGTIMLAGDGVLVHERQQPLTCGRDFYRMPVVRIEAARSNPPNFSNEQVEKVVSHALRIAGNPSYHGLQIDFDANRGQRNAYRAILKKLRQSLPTEVPLSMTAIASWCSGDYWLADLPVDEVVPMYFDMGVGQNEEWQYVKDISDNTRLGQGRNCKCHSALGLAISKPIDLSAAQYARKRIYLFSHHSWQKSSDKEKAEITKILKYTEAS